MLRGRNLGEADRILTLLTRDDGKRDAVAKGVRRAKSQFAGRLEFLSTVAVNLHRGRSLDVITTASLVRSRFDALARPEALAVAGVMAELVDGFCELELPVPEIFALLDGALDALGRSVDPARILPRFQLRLLHLLGVGPQTDACVRCGEALDAGAWADLEGGGLACATCRRGRGEVVVFDEAALGAMQRLGLERGDSRAMLDAPTEVARAIDAFVHHHLGKRPKARAFVGVLDE